ncbi:MAG: elongation factor G [Pirellulaceae bacterium]|jgi:elongation factor G
MSRNIEKIRNIGIIAHIDAGKTTVTERMLFYSGAKHRSGEVDKGTTTTDDDAEEQDRGITIYAACVTFDWKDFHVNLLDTPGHVDFTAEVERCLRVLDGAVVVFSAREGVEAQSETVWRQADRYNVPRIAFINKLDREGANYESVLKEIEDRLEGTPIPIQIPVGEGPAHVENPFRGIIDLIEMKLLEFDPATDGRTIKSSDISEELLDGAIMYRETMIESLCNYSDEMMELALEEVPIGNDLIRKVLREATLARLIQPVVYGSALHFMGVQPVLDAVVAYLPSPLDRPPVEGDDPKNSEKKIARKPDVKEPFCGLVFKLIPAKTGDIAWIRIYSGELKSNTRILNVTQNKKDNVAQLWQIHATKRDRDGQVDSVRTGDIVGVIGMRHASTGDTVTDVKSPILLESIDFPETVMSMAIEPESSAERQKLEDTLNMLRRQDPTIQVKSGDTGQTLISGMGELHLEVIKNRLLRDFKLNVKFHKPQVSYRESVEHSVEVVGECNRVVGGEQLFARVKVRIEPVEDSAIPVVVLTQLPPDRLTGDLHSVVLDEFRICGEGGGRIAGFPLMKLKITLLDAEMSEEGSNETAFRIATNDAFQKGLDEGGRVLLEPIMRLDITTPEEYMGDFVGDLNQRRAIIARTDQRGSLSVIEAHAPLRELFGYSSAMRSLSQGRAGHSMEPLKYAAAPAEVRKAYQFD